MDPGNGGLSTKPHSMSDRIPIHQGIVSDHHLALLFCPKIHSRATCSSLRMYIQSARDGNFTPIFSFRALRGTIRKKRLQLYTEDLGALTREMSKAAHPMHCGLRSSDAVKLTSLIGPSVRSSSPHPLDPTRYEEPWDRRLLITHSHIHTACSRNLLFNLRGCSYYIISTFSTREVHCIKPVFFSSSTSAQKKISVWEYPPIYVILGDTNTENCQVRVETDWYRSHSQARNLAGVSNLALVFSTKNGDSIRCASLQRTESRIRHDTMLGSLQLLFSQFAHLGYSPNRPPRVIHGNSSTYDDISRHHSCHSHEQIFNSPHSFLCASK